MLTTRSIVVRENIPGSAGYRPTRLKTGALKQFHVLARIPSDAHEVIYTRTIAARTDGADACALQVTLRVLPFTLPPHPAPRHDLSLSYTAVIYTGDTLDWRQKLGQTAAGFGAIRELS